MVDGSDKTGEDLVAGTFNFAEDSTFHLAQQRKGSFFDGTAILIVEPAGFIKDKDDFEKIRERTLHGIVGTANGDGVGIIGINPEHPFFAPGEELSAKDLALAHSAGVFGKGTSGIVGQGETRAATPANMTKELGAGVIGQGGKSLNVAGAGVVGIGGGVEGFVPNPVVAPVIGAGVTGLGSTGMIGEGILGPGVRGSGSRSEAGVFGIGGKEGEDPQGNKTPQGPGVIGLATERIGLPPNSESSETGVYGAGQNGVKGVGLDGRGGVFVSARSAQVQLVPAKGRLVPAPGHHVVDTQSFTPERVTNPLPALPRTGQGGDLMTLTDNLEQCTLWLCVQGGTDSNKAIWAQVLLGPSFDGTA